MEPNRLNATIGKRVWWLDVLGEGERDEAFREDLNVSRFHYILLYIIRTTRSIFEVLRHLYIAFFKEATKVRSAETFMILIIS